MRLLRQSGKEFIVSVSRDEVRLINNALNEVINALDISEFSTRLGVELGEAKALLKDFASAAKHDSEADTPRVS